jgi:hypothetical protein
MKRSDWRSGETLRLEWYNCNNKVGMCNDRSDMFPLQFRSKMLSVYVFIIIIIVHANPKSIFIISNVGKSDCGEGVVPQHEKKIMGFYPNDKSYHFIQSLHLLDNFMRV